MLQNEPIILASKSASRRAMLDAVGIEYKAIPAEIDERELEAKLEGASPAQVAIALAEAKALAVSKTSPGKIVLGSDSLVEVDRQRFDKPRDRDQAAEHLRFFSGKVMKLHSAAALAQNGEIAFRCGELAKLQFRQLSESFIEDYLASEWPEVGYCVGVFRIEALGPLLFERITGDQFTVLGMPLLEVLGALRFEGVLAA